MAISGSFKASTRYQPDPRGTAKNWGVGVEPGHTGRDEIPYGFPKPAPIHRLEAPQFIEDQFDLSRMPPTHKDADTETASYNGTKYTYESLDQHIVPTLPRGVKDTNRLRQMSWRLHNAQKRVFPSQMASKVSRGFMDTFDSTRVQSLPQTPMGTGGVITGQALRALRGRNSLAVNNPGQEYGPDTGNYVRQGWELSRLSDRPMKRRGITHTKRALHVNVAHTGVESPGMPGPYTSSVGSFGSLRVGTAKPGVRREPRRWDEDIATDFTTDNDPQFWKGF